MRLKHLIFFDQKKLGKMGHICRDLHKDESTDYEDCLLHFSTRPHFPPQLYFPSPPPPPPPYPFIFEKNWSINYFALVIITFFILGMLIATIRTTRCRGNDQRTVVRAHAHTAGQHADQIPMSTIVIHPFDSETSAATAICTAVAVYS